MIDNHDHMAITSGFVPIDHYIADLESGIVCTTDKFVSHESVLADHHRRGQVAIISVVGNPRSGEGEPYGPGAVNAKLEILYVRRLIPTMLLLREAIPG
jgi:hypothetical protein